MFQKLILGAFLVASFSFAACDDTPNELPEIVDVILELRNLTNNNSPCSSWPPTPLDIDVVSFNDKNATDLIMSTTIFLQPSESEVFSVDVAYNRFGIVTFEATDDTSQITNTAYDQFYEQDGYKWRFDYFIENHPSNGCQSSLLYKGRFPI